MELEILVWVSVSEPHGSHAKLISSASQKDLLDPPKSCGVVLFLLSVKLMLSPVGEQSQAAQCRHFSGTPFKCSCLYVCVYIRHQISAT